VAADLLRELVAVARRAQGLGQDAVVDLLVAEGFRRKEACAIEDALARLAASPSSGEPTDG
jgi:hypothetical protein